MEAWLSPGGENNDGEYERPEDAEPVGGEVEAAIEAGTQPFVAHGDRRDRDVHKLLGEVKGEVHKGRVTSGEVGIGVEDEVTRLGDGGESAEGVTAEDGRGSGLAGVPVARGD